MIGSFDGKYRFLSNFVVARVVLDGREYPTVEHAYQAAKTLANDERLAIRECSTPADAKRAGRRVTMRPDWNAVRVDIMRGLLQQKFRSGSIYAAALLETGDEELVEGNYWGDVFWGVCRGRGENWLGRLLMEQRDSLR